MSLASAAPLSHCYDIKSADLPLLALLLKTSDIDAVEAALKAQLQETPDFYAQEPVVIDVTALDLDDSCPLLDFAGLTQMLRLQGMLPLAIKGAVGIHKEAALSCGLVEASDLRVRKNSPQPSTTEPLAATVEPQPLPHPPLDVPGTLVIDKPLRSGQQIYAKGGDLIVLAMVNAGAEVIADGHIHVYAPLRGKAIAGARGNTQARIFAQCMEPELIAIAGIYRTTDKALAAEVQGRPAQVYLHSGPDGEKLMVQALTV
jgi:septum site-determining protein MinC